MTQNEKAIMLAMENALHKTAKKHEDKALASNDEKIKHDELERYSMNIFAAVAVAKLIKQLEDFERYGHV